MNVGAVNHHSSSISPSRMMVIVPKSKFVPARVTDSLRLPRHNGMQLASADSDEHQR